MLLNTLQKYHKYQNQLNLCPKMSRKEKIWTKRKPEIFMELILYRHQYIWTCIQTLQNSVKYF